ncbi:Sulfhydryl oxidase [Aphelenchoides besseyi]|nr:Sulfhydryl oxidase [Aphelenchoides besseyi]KAI6195091.1 Sulfhydryl oxidase [Aphelenchoides besseyi]
MDSNACSQPSSTTTSNTSLSPKANTSRTSCSSTSERERRRKEESELLNCGYRRSTLAFALLIVALQFDSTVAEKSLYTDKDHVLELDVTNFDQSIYNQPRAFFVEFYASWCGHCIHYKPTFVQFATSLRSWTSTVQVTVVNCAAEENSPLCRQHAIAAFPTLKVYFKVNSKSKDDGDQFQGDKYNLPEMTKSVVDLVRKDYEHEHPIGWPKLELTPSTSTLSDLWSSASTASLLAVVVDKEPYGDGYAAMINYHSDPHVHLVVVNSTHPIAVQFGGLAVPSLYVFKRDNPHSPSYSSNEVVDFAKIQMEIDKLTENLPAAAVPNQAVEPPSQHAVVDTKRTVDVVNWRQFEVQYLDLTSALKYMLTQEIPRRNTIDGFHLKVLKDWIHVLRAYLPLSPPVRRLFYKLDEYIQPLNTMTADEWLGKVKAFQEELGHPLPSESKYLACKGSQSNLRGYTCGLWTTFHVITVEAYKQNKHNPSFSPYAEVLEPIHQFIYNYLSCSECAKNFDKMAKETLSSVRTPEDTVLWLWRAHNRANKRLSGAAAEDPHFPKQQFPPTSICSRCHRQGGEFDEAEVLKFLTEYYADIKTDQVRPEPAYKVNEYADGKLKKISDKHLNPKFAGMSGKVDRMEEAEKRLNDEKARPWGNGDLNYMSTHPRDADRKTYYFILLMIFAVLVIGIYYKYRQNRHRFWKSFYNYKDDYKYKFMPWSKDQSSNLMKYTA